VQWANVDDLKLLGGDTSVPSGQWLRVSMRFDDSDSPSTISLYLDRDRNPYNGNTVTRLDRRSSAARGAPTPIKLAGSTVEASAGTYFVYAQIRDAGGRTRYAYLQQSITVTDPIEADRFASLNSGTLNALGTTRRDRFFLTTDGTNINVTRDDFTQRFLASDVHNIVVDAGAGDDFLVLGDNMIASTLIGGAGRDVLIGSAGNDVLSGGANKDRLFGGSGNDQITASGGNDVLVGGDGADTLAGGAGTDSSDNDSADTRIAIEVLS
jgi:hypothetical protein